MKQKWVALARWIVGILFVFSGFVKGIDPSGFQYKLEDYFEALHLQGLSFLAVTGSFLLPFAEYAIGIMLITGILIRLSTKLVFLFMLLVTPLTLYIALKNPVTDCGCFGDALVISNWQTFSKNIVLIILVILLLVNRNRLLFFSTTKFRKISFTLLLLGYISVVYWSCYHEPVIDFRPYKVGVNITEGMSIPDGAPADVYQTTYHYRNRQSNELKRFGDHDFPWQDTLHWKFESMDSPLLIKKGYRPPIHDFSIQTAEQQNVTDTYLKDSLYTFFVIAYDLEKSSDTKQKRLNELANWAKQNGYRFVGLTSTAGAALHKFQLDEHPAYDFLFADQTTLKTMIRSNPGLMLLHKGTILAKWAYADFPTTEEASAIIRSRIK